MSIHGNHPSWGCVLSHFFYQDGDVASAARAINKLCIRATRPPLPQFNSMLVCPLTYVELTCTLVKEADTILVGGKEMPPLQV